MSFLGWMTVVGALLLVMALSSSQIQRAPVSTAAIYLALGVLLGPAHALLEDSTTRTRPYTRRP